MTTSVDIQGMQLAQEDFQAALDQMNSVYSAMTEEQDNLSASWSGMAASAFGQALGAWLDDLHQIRQELVVMTESLSTHTGIYSDANETSQQVAAAFQQGLGGLEELPTEPMLAAPAGGGEVAAPGSGGRPAGGGQAAAGGAGDGTPGGGPLLPEESFRARRLEEPLLPEESFTARRLAEPLGSVESVPDGWVPSETQPRFFKSVRELPSEPGKAPIPDLPRSRILESDLPVLPTLPARELERPTEPTS